MDLNALKFKVTSVTLVLFLFTIESFAGADDLVHRLINDIKSGPSVFYSPEALSYFSGHGSIIEGTVDKDAALKTFGAIVKLADLGPQANAAIPILVSKFPKGVHVMQVNNAEYNGEGTMDDWVSTYLMSAKNQFMLSSPFLDYNSMARCEGNISNTYQTQIVQKTPNGKRAIVNITIVFTFNAASCALSSITGQDLGVGPDVWRQWWAINSVNFTNTNPQSSSGSTGSEPISQGKAFSDIVVGGKYRMSLTTGDDLVGIVESKDDSSMILETTDGKPYVFKPSLLVRYDLLEAPKNVVKKADVSKSTTITEAQIVTYEDLKGKGLNNVNAEVKIKSGTIFKGKMVSIDDEMMKLDVDGSSIPISKDVVDQITLLPNTPQKQVVKDDTPKGPLDTIRVANPKKDDYGNAKPEIVYTGLVNGENDKNITMKLTTGDIKVIDRNQITRIVRHTDDNFDGPIKVYAKPLYCPPGMILIDMPPGKPGRPFFKVCIDKFEYPNREGSVPQGNFSYSDAKKSCEQQGKRLCSEDEWRWACSGLEGYAYPYGWNQEKEKCNTEGTRQLEASGSRVNCVSKFGGYDMTGNIFEWVSTNKGEAGLMGGPFSKCQTVSPGVSGDAKPQTGLRCCKSN